jgi:hypothetical protein
LYEGVKIKKAHFAVNLAVADWTGLELTAIYTSNTMSWQSDDFGATELRPGERTDVKIQFSEKQEPTDY